MHPIARLKSPASRRVATVAALACAAAYPGLALAQAAASAAAKAPDGARVFATTCAACHQPTGAGLEDKYPPLAGSEWVVGDDAKLIRIVLGGLTGPVEVAGETFTAEMPGWAPILKDAEIAAVLTYIRSSWGNKAAPITPAMIATIRTATTSRKTPWTVAELAHVISIKK